MVSLFSPFLQSPTAYGILSIRFLCHRALMGIRIKEPKKAALNKSGNAVNSENLVLRQDPT